MNNGPLHIKIKIKRFLLAVLVLCANHASMAQITISGTITLRDTTLPVHNVSVILSGDQSEVVLTDENGYYEFTVAQGGNYTVTPANNSSFTCGVSTLDFVIISRHLNGIDTISSPYQLIAADVNNDNSIDAFDLIDLENAILLQSIQFPNNSSWRFISSNFSFDNPSPFPGPWEESTIFSNIQSSQSGINFIGIKIGEMQNNSVCIVADVCNIDCSTIQGTIAYDANNDCSIDPNELNLFGWYIQAISSTDTFTTVSNIDGGYLLTLPANTYSLSATPKNQLWNFCANDFIVEANAGAIATQNFEAQAVQTCHLLNVDISNSFLRRCFPSYYSVSYSNEGTDVINDASVEVTLDSLVTLTNSSLPFSSQNGNIYTFDIGSVAINECQILYLTVEVSCDAQLEETLCASAEIFPESNCAGPALWDGAHLELTAECEGEEVIFTITNTGAPMTEALDYVIIEDDMIMMVDPNGNSLGTMESFEMPVTANGSTWRMEVNQSSNHPFSEKISSAIEGCGENDNGEVSLGFIGLFPQLSSNPNVDTDCNEVRGSFDPNDKSAAPIGVHEQHYIEENTSIDYKIRFQNTGTDTAFTVVIRDEISRHLDVTTLRPTGASHNYIFSMEENMAVFTFPNIMLPDSFVNEAASHGYVSFQIDQQRNNPIETLIENEVDIYFDFNEPVRTNTVFHTIGEDFLEIINNTPVVNGKEFEVLLAPNPMVDFTSIKITGVDLNKGSLTLYNQQGQLSQQYNFTGNQVNLYRNELSTGFYLFEIREKGELLSTGKLLIR